jgi:hypothetical protein
MNTTMYASFTSLPDAEKAIGALMDYGARAEDISLVAHESHAEHAFRTDPDADTVKDVEGANNAGKSGLSTTTAADAGAGAAKGAGIGLGVGIAAAVASVLLPGIGLVLGGGALALALAGAAGTAGAGAVAGGAFGYLKDQGMAPDRISRFNDVVTSGGAVLAVTSSDKLDVGKVREVLTKYNAQDVDAHGAVLI